MKTRSAARTRRGTFVPLLALTITGLLSFVALAIDLGMLTVGRTECQNAADVAALTGARVLNNRSGLASMNDKDLAVSTVKDVVPNNTFISTGFTTPTDAKIQIGKYAYNTGTQRFAPDFVDALAAGESWTAVRVTLNETQPTFFAKIMGVSSLPNGAVATAVHRPRDVAIVLDFSVSMRFGSMMGWMAGMGGSNDVVFGSLNPDPSYPKFGHYGRYTQYVNNPSLATMKDTTAATAAQSSSPSTRPNPMQILTTFTANSEEVHAPNNHTVETPGGPPIVMDFRFDSSNRKTPTTKVTTVNVNAQGQGLWNAFHRWFTTTPSDTPDTSLALVDQTNNFKYSGFRPPVATTVDNTGSGAAAVVRTFNWAAYNPFDLDSTSGPVPAPDSFATQQGFPTASVPPAPVPYAGDVHPGKKGIAVDPNANPTNYWDPFNANGPAVNAAEMLGWGSNNPVTTAGSGTPPDRTAFPAGTASGTTAGLWGYEPRGAGNGYAANWSNFRDAAWERYGYDLNVNDYVTNRPKTSGGPTWDPRWDYRLGFLAGTTNANAVGWQTMVGAGTTATWVHNMKTITGGSPADNPPNLRTVPPDSAVNGTGARAAQSISFRPILLNPNPLGGTTTTRISSFNGYSMGPGYYGKTFFLWPPDPRYGVQNPNTGATTIWPDPTSPDWPALTSNTYSTDAPNADPAFSTKGKSGTTTTTYTKATGLIPMCDWRRRFFLPSAGSETNPASGFDPATTNIDTTLFSTSTTKDSGNAGTGTAGVLKRGNTFKVNYRAVLAWIKTGPQVFPTNLRAGRIVYYTSIPDNCDSAGSDTDQRFWRDYIDYVLGYTGNVTNYNPEYETAGVEYKPWPEGGSLSTGATAGYGTAAIWTAAKPVNADLTTPAPAKTANNPAQTTDPVPYSNYTTNPNRPRMYFWFGPQTMIDFTSCRSTDDGGSGADRHWWSGNVHEAQCWQLKAAMNSALSDIQANHPNDCAGMAYFASINYTVPRVPMGQGWINLRNSLFYPGPNPNNSSSFNLLPLLNPTSGSPDTTTELAPYDNGSMYGGRLTGNVTNANGGTDPNTGFAMGFNLLSSASSLSTTDYGTIKGRRGAAKIVIYETDGVPNANPTWGIQGGGTNTYYTYNSGSNETYPVAGLTDPITAASLDLNFNNNATPKKIALAVVQRTVAPATTSTTTKSGFSLPNTPARVYPIGFGDLFTGYDGTNTWAGPSAAVDGVKFLLRTGQAGNTLGTTGNPPLPLANVISGSYQNRITTLRSTLERIMQSGVQVTLIE